MSMLYRQIKKIEDLAQSLKKSPSDPKEYRLLKLSNGVKLLHVEDAQSPTCAIAVKINTGSFSDPDDCHGLAHLLEHCLFTGSKNYPNDNTLNQFLDAHQGQLNAWTAGESTVFYFKVHHQFFKSSLEIFFDMLLKPLFSLEGIEKELNTIDSEFLNKITEEQRRILEVQKHIVNSDHPFSKFSVGNSEIFGKYSHDVMQEKLRDYWQSAFCASNISVCISTNSISSSCIEFVKEQLLCFPHFDKTPPVLPSLYLNEHLQRKILINTQRCQHRLVLIFSLEDGEQSYRQKNEALLSHLFGYEGAGSLLHFWKSKHWASQVIAGTGLHGSNFLDFNLYIELSETGLDYVDEIIHSVLFYAELIKEALKQLQPEQHSQEKQALERPSLQRPALEKPALKKPALEKHYQEKAKLNRIAFEHQPKQNALDTVLHLVKNMDLYPDDELLAGEYIMDKFDPVSLASMLYSLRPERLRCLSISPNHVPDVHTKWYKVPYSDSKLILSELENTLQQDLVQHLHLPPANSYVPDLNTSFPEEESAPTFNIGSTLNSRTNTNIWSGINTKSSGKKGECFLSWRKTEDFCSLENVAHRKLFCSATESKLNDIFYPAQLAGIHFSFYSHQTGVGMHTSGFAEKQLELCKDIIEVINAKPGDCPDFELNKQEYINTLLSSIRNKPLNRLFTALQALCVPASWLPEDLAKTATNATQKDIQQTHKSLFDQFYLEGLIYGHWQPTAIEGFITELSSLKGCKEPTHNQYSINLSDKQWRSLYFPCEHNDAAIVVYLQSPEKNLKNQIYTMLIETLLAGFYFDWMRNQKQLGYQVGTGYMPFNEHPGIAMYIQSSVAGPAVLYAETRSCMRHFHKWLQNLNDEQWLKYQHSLVRQLDSSAISFEVQCQRYWSAIGRNPVDFNFEKHLQEAVAKIAVADLCHWFYETFLQKDVDFCLYTEGKQELTQSDFEHSLPSIYHFKKTQPW